MQIWKSNDIFVFIQKWYGDSFTLQQYLLLEICAPEICEMFVYKHIEKIVKNVKNQPTFKEKYNFTAK